MNCCFCFKANTVDIDKGYDLVEANSTRTKNESLNNKQPASNKNNLNESNSNEFNNLFKQTSSNSYTNRAFDPDLKRLAEIAAKSDMCNYFLYFNSNLFCRLLKKIQLIN